MHNPRGCWRECAAAAIALFCCLGLNINTFVVYIPYLTEALELSYTQSSNFLLVRNLFSFGAVVVAKHYYDRLEIRLGYTLAMVMGAVSLFLYANVQSFAGLCVAAAMSGLCCGLGGMYPASILIHRWFHIHEGLAIGIGSASSGVALTLGAPMLTSLIENFSMGTAMYLQIGFQLVCTLVCFLLIRNYPAGVLHHKIRHHAKRQPIRINVMILAVLVTGTMNGSFSFLTTHYTTEGFDPYQISTIMSVFGLVLTVSKFAFGELTDLWGTYRTNWLFLPVAVLSLILFGLGGTLGYGIAVTAAVLFGIGDSVATVGITAYGKDLSSPEEYATTQQQYLMANLLGGLVCAPIPGLVASVTGNYRAFYCLVALLMVLASVVIQRAYVKQRKQ